VVAQALSLVSAAHFSAEEALAENGCARAGSRGGRMGNTPSIRPRQPNLRGRSKIMGGFGTLPHSPAVGLFLPSVIGRTDRRRLAGYAQSWLVPHTTSRYAPPGPDPATRLGPTFFGASLTRQHGVSGASRAITGNGPFGSLGLTVPNLAQASFTPRLHARGSAHPLRRTGGWRNGRARRLAVRRPPYQDRVQDAQRARSQHPRRAP